MDVYDNGNGELLFLPCALAAKLGKRRATDAEFRQFHYARMKPGVGDGLMKSGGFVQDENGTPIGLSGLQTMDGEEAGPCGCGKRADRTEPQEAARAALATEAPEVEPEAETAPGRVGPAQLARGAVGLAKAALGIDQASEEVQAQRWKACQACPAFRRGVCSDCGCHVSGKLQVRGEKCPRDRWRTE